MELIVETYDLFKRGLGLTPAELAPIYDRWNREELNSFLVEITAKIFTRQDDRTGKPLVDLILDKAKQKGTGMWTSWDAMDLQVGTPTIDAAVVMRDMSGYKEERLAASQVLAGPSQTFKGDRQRFIGQVKNALYAGMIATYAQGLALLQKASATYDYGLDLEAVARIWRGGCIIRAALLEDIRAAYKTNADLPNLLMDPHLGKEFLSRAGGLAGSGADGRRPGAAGPGPDGDPELLRRLPQRRAAGQPDPGPAGLLRGAYLRAPGRPRRLPHRVGGGVIPGCGQNGMGPAKWFLRFFRLGLVPQAPFGAGDFRARKFPPFLKGSLV